jgi:outer membrane protein TolC
MIGLPSFMRPRAARLVTGLVVPVLLSVAGHCRSDEPPPVKVAAPAGTPLADLASFRATALERQPSVVAARASLSAGQARSQAVGNMRLGPLFARDLPIRREQACLGLQASEAALRLAEADTSYAVTYCYLAHVYARQQQAVLLYAKKDLADVQKLVSDTVKGEQYKKFLGKEHERLVASYVETIEGRRQETLQGMERALAALREAMNLPPEDPVRPALKWMPNAAVNASTTKEDVVALALSRRGEIVSTEIARQVTSLEISAQGRTFLPTLRTFAAASDIHAQSVPAGKMGGFDYQPAALGPEMPSMLVGSRRARMGQASDYLARAEAVVEKTRNLITLEAEDAFFRWKEAKVKSEHLKKAADDAEAFSAFMRKKFRDAVESGFKVADPTREPPATRVEEVLIAGATAIHMRVDANRAFFDYLLAVANLERVTAGGFCVEFLPAPEPKNNGNGNGK